MKNKIMAIAMILSLTAMISSCTTSRSSRKQYGCPMAQVSEKSVNI